MYNDEKLLTVAELMELLGVGKPKVMEILMMPDCPHWPRLKKRSPWLVPYGAFMKWYNSQIKGGKR